MRRLTDSTDTLPLNRRCWTHHRLKVLSTGAMVCALGGVSGQINGPGIGRDRFEGSSLSAEEISSCCVKPVVASQVRVVNDGRGDARSVNFANSCGSGERNDRCGVHDLQLVVELEDLVPVRLHGGGRICVDRVDGGEKLVGARRPRRSQARTMR